MVCYLILGAFNQKNIPIIFSQLNCPNTTFIIHIDQKIEITDEIKRLEKHNANFQLIPENQRTNCNWSGYSLVKSMISLISHGENASKEDTTFQFLSDSCTSLRPAEYVRDELIRRGTNIHFWGKLEATQNVHLNERFFRNYWIFDTPYLNHKNYKSKFTSKAIKYVEIALRLPLLTLKRKLPDYIHKGSQWFSITKTDWISIKSTLPGNFNKPFMNARAPDEMYFQSAAVYGKLIAPTEAATMKANGHAHANHFIDWSNPAAGPKVLDNQDLEGAKRTTDALFARKVP